MKEPPMSSSCAIIRSYLYLTYIKPTVCPSNNSSSVLPLQPLVITQIFSHSTEFRGKAPTPFVIPLPLCSHTPNLGHQRHQPSNLRVTHAKHSPPDPCKPDHHR